MRTIILWSVVGTVLLAISAIGSWITSLALVDSYAVGTTVGIVAVLAGTYVKAFVETLQELWS